jgi:hypothetical protein
MYLKQVLEIKEKDKIKILKKLLLLLSKMFDILIIFFKNYLIIK